MRPMRNVCFGCAVLMLSLAAIYAGGCAHSQPNVTADLLKAHYPIGQSREEILAHNGKSREYSLTDGESQPRIVWYHLDQIKKASAGEAVKYDVFLRAGVMPTSIHNPMALGAYNDYVYYDRDDRCVWVGTYKVD